MKKLFFVAFCLAFAACGASQQNSTNAVSNQPKTSESPIRQKNEKPKFNPAEVVKFSVAPVEIKAGSSAQAEIKLTIVEPFHVNSNPPSEKAFIPLEISVENSEGITAGKPVYPKGVMKKFEFSSTPLSVYEGDTIVKLPLRAEKSTVGQKTLKGKLSFQPCDHEVCYPPQKVDVTLPITVN